MILHILKPILIILEVIIVFNLMIIVHELGHFLAARWRGLVIEKFGIWFGKPIWKKKINGVEYSLGSIPAGGFVALPQLAPMEVMEGKVETPREQLPPISALDKIIVAFAGPLFSFGLATIFAVIVWQVGRPVSEAEGTRVVGFVAPESPASAAGIQVGDEILGVDGQPVTRWGGMGADSIMWRIVRSEGATIPVKVKRGNDVLPAMEVTPKIPETKVWERRGLRKIMIGPAETPMVAKVVPGSPAARAGLQPNDLVTAVNGQRIYSESGISDYATAHPTEALRLTVKRDDHTLEIPFELNSARVGATIKDSPAALAGLKPGDRVISVDGQSLRTARAISEYVQSHNAGPLKLEIERTAANAATPERKIVEVTPVAPVGETKPRLGLEWASDDSVIWDAMGPFTVIHPKPLEQIRKSVGMIADTIGAVASKKSGIGVQHMGGPVMMMRAYYVMFENKEGWRMALWFSVVLNVNLALLNMLPIPVLDGGHITLACIEAVRRRPVNVRILEYVQSACALVIIGFMLFIAFFDVQDLPWFGGHEQGASMKFKPAETQK